MLASRSVGWGGVGVKDCDNNLLYQMKAQEIGRKLAGVDDVKVSICSHQLVWRKVSSAFVLVESKQRSVTESKQGSASSFCTSQT